jgi:hypothetical protein
MFVSPRFSEKKKAKGTGLLRKAVNFSRDYLKEFFGTFYGAQIFSLPLIYYFFARVSNIAVVSNLLEIPVISAILTMSIIFTVLAPLGYWMGSLISFPLDILLSYFIGVINFTAEYNGGNLINAPFSFLALFGVTSALTAVYYALSFRRKLFRGMAAASALIFVLLSASTVVYPYDSGKMYVTFVGYNDTSSAVITTGTGENIFVGALNELLYWSSNTPIKLNTVNPLIIVTDVGDPADLKEISDAYRIKNIVTPAAYKYALTFMPNVTFIEGNVNTVYKDVEISLVSDGTNIYEAVFGYKGTELSFSSDGQYVLENILSGESAKYAVINYAGSSRDRNEKDHGFTENIEKIKNSENFDKSLVLFSKKYYNDYIKRYDNFSILEFDENGVRSLE